MIEIIDKHSCCGCSSCVQKCPKKCISMYEDDEGFLYPVVDKEKCIDCGLCEIVCPCHNDSEKKRTNLPDIYAIKNKPKEVIKHILSHKSDELCISAISYGELMHGVEKSTYREKNYLALSLFLSSITILQFDGIAAEKYGLVRAGLETMGTPIGPMDTLIAAHALSKDLILVTNNTREFCRVDGLKLEDWTIA